ncbi:hypothetical protein BOX15_Mlig019119g1, partial [Macrostomum lignano]
LKSAMTSQLVVKTNFSQATDDTNLVIRRIHEKCRAVLATIAYLRRIFLRKEALSQLEALQFLLLGQHQEIIHAVNAVCHELLQKQRQEFNSLMSAANGTLAVLCCWLDKALLSSDAFNHIAGNGLISGYQGKIEALIATCQGLPMDSLDCASAPARNSLPTASELDRCLDDEKMMQSILTVSQRLKSLQGPSADDPAAGASASFLAAGADNGSSVGSTDSIGSSVESGGSEDSTQSEEEFTEDLVSVNGVLYKRKVRKRRRQKVVRTRTVVMSSGPPLALTATDCLALGPAQPQLPLPPHLQEQQQQLAASSEAGRDASFRSDATSGYHSIMFGASDFPPPPPPPPPPQQQKQQPSPASQPDGSPPPKPPPPGSVSDPMSESVVSLRKPEEPSQRLVNQYMQMLAGYDRELTDFSRHSMDSFNMFHSRWHKLVSSDAPHERSKTISLVTHECRQPRAGLIVHRNTTISHTARVRHVPAASAAQQPPIPMADDLGSDEDAGVAPAAAAAPSAMPGGEDSLYEQLPPTPPTTKPLLSATSETAAAAAADASSEEPLEAYFYDQLEEFLVWDPATDPAVAEAEDRIRVRAGPLDALLVHACCPATEGARQHLLFCESLAATYRCFASSHELVGRIVSRAIFFLAAGRDLLWKPAFAFLVRVLDEVSSECDQEMLDDLGLLKQRLVGEGRLPEAQILATALAGVRQRQAEAAQPDPAAAAAASALAAQRRSITDFTPRQLAEQITLMDSRLYRRIEIQEYLAFVRGRSREQFANLQAFINSFNRLGFWVKTLVLGSKTTKMKERQRLLSYFLKVADELKRLHNFNSHLAIVFSLISLDQLPWPGRSVRQRLRALTSCLGDQAAFARDYFRNMGSTEPPLVPHVGEVLKYLTRIHEGAVGGDEVSSLPPDYPVSRAKQLGLMPVINYWKYWVSFNCLDFCIRFKRYSAKAMHYPFALNPELLACLNNFNDALSEPALNDLLDQVRQKYMK